MTPGEIAALEDRVCLGTRPLTVHHAHRQTVAHRGVAYRCPFRPAHWHVDPLLDGTLDRIADMLRAR